MPKVEPIWLTYAKRQVGVKEIPGKVTSPAIRRWLMALKAWWHDDETPWCGVFVAHVFQVNGWTDLPKYYMRAKEWAGWGKALRHDQLAPGAVLVFARTGGGHVGFYIGEDSTRYYVLGGNQGNAVSYAWIKKDRLTACRWPAEVPVPTTGKAKLTDNGQPTSINEA